MSQKIAIQIVGDEKDLRRAFRSAEDSSKTFAESFRRDAEILTRWGKRGAQAIVGIAAAVAGISLKGGIDRLMGLERANKQLDQLGVVGAEADGLMESLLDTLRGTPFALDAGAASLAGFVASGREIGDIPRLVQQVTDAAAFGNTTLEEVDFLWQRIQTTGRVTNEELRMLAERNIPVYHQLAGAIGVGADEIMEMAARGEISADEFFDAWERAAEGTEDGTKRIAGAAQAMGDTTEGAWGNMRTAMSRFGATLLDDVFPLAKDALNAIGEGFDRMGEIVSNAFANLDPSDIEAFIGQIPELMENATIKVIEFWEATETLRETAGTVFSGIASILTNEVLVAIGAVSGALALLYAHPVIAGIGTIAFAFGTVNEMIARTKQQAEEVRDLLLEISIPSERTKGLTSLLTPEQQRALNEYDLTVQRLANTTLPELQAAKDNVIASVEGENLLTVATGSAYEEVLELLDILIAVEHERASAHLESAEAQHRAEAEAIALGDAQAEQNKATEESIPLTEEQIAAQEAAAEAAGEFRGALGELEGATDRTFSQMASDVEGFLDGFSELPDDAETTMSEFEENFRTRVETMQRFWDGIGVLAERGLGHLVDELVREGPSAVGVVEEYVANPTEAAIQNSFIKGSEEGLLEAQALVAGWGDITGPVINFGASLPFIEYPEGSTGPAVIPRGADRRMVHGQAEGGIVKARPGGTLFQRGEAGDDEAVIPFDQRGISILAQALREALGSGNGRGGGGGDTYHHHEWKITSTGSADVDAQKAGALYSIVRRMETRR